MNINDITITSLETINAFDIATGAFKFTLDELQNATIAQTQEKTDITGKQGRKLNSLKKNKAVTISGTNGLVSGGLLEMQVGSEFENKKTTVKWPNVYRIQFYIPKADFNGEFSFEMGDNQTVHAFEAESLSGACGTSGALWTYTIFGSNAEDVA